MIDPQGFIVDNAQSTLEVPTGDSIAYLRITTECISDKGVFYKKVQHINIIRQQEIENKNKENKEKTARFKKFSETTEQYKRNHSNKRNKLK